MYAQVATIAAWLHVLGALVLSPLLLAVVNRTKAFVAGRKGQPLLQPYRDLAKLLRKGAVFSETTTAVFRLGPAVGLAAALTALLLVPAAGWPAVLAFPGDLVLLAYLLGLLRFLYVVAALDTGSSFEGMGASREAFFSALAEPALFLALAAVARLTGHLSLSGILGAITPELWARAFPVLLLATCALAVVFLVENARIPVDDPTTHLELTMIHEVMVLDHSGPDLALIQYTAALKFWLLGAVIVGLAVPVRAGPPPGALAFLAGMFALAIAVGLTESVMARLRLDRVPRFIMGAGMLAALALFLEPR